MKAPHVHRPAAPAHAPATCSCGRKLRGDFTLQRSSEAGRPEAVDPEERLARADRFGHSLGRVQSARDLAPKNSGRPLPEPVRRRMEESLGGDLSAVRIHEGPEASSIGAIAFTRGTAVHFASGSYDPFSRPGQRLLGHELAHVLQQRLGRVAVPRNAAVPINDDPSLEAEADRWGERAAQGRPAAPAPGPTAAPVQRKEDPAAGEIPEAEKAPKVSKREKARRFFSHVGRAAKSGGRKLLGGLGVAGGGAAMALGTLVGNEGLNDLGSWGFSKGKALLKPPQEAKPEAKPKAEEAPKEQSKAERVAAARQKVKALANKCPKPEPDAVEDDKAAEKKGSGILSRVQGGLGMVGGLARIAGGIVTANPLLLGRGVKGMAAGFSALRGEKEEASAPLPPLPATEEAPAAEAAPESHPEEEAQDRHEERAQEQEAHEEQASEPAEESQAGELEAHLSARQQGRFPSSSQRRAARRGEKKAARVARRSAKARRHHLRETRKAGRGHQRRQRHQQRSQRRAERSQRRSARRAARGPL